jgi:ABC-type nitrate/sulfonate/bicarbonate transport system ATPase subunit
MGELRVENLVKSYQRKEGWNTTRTLRVFDKVSFAVREGEFVCIIGPSGCGKSTLLNLSAGLDQTSGGSVYVDGREVHGPGLDRGVVFQEFALMPWLTVMGNIEFGLRSKGVPAAERKKIAQRYVDLVGLSGFENFHPYRLSGGMRQRVGLARALAIEPSVLLMDEPFGALDAQTRESMQKALEDIWEATKKTVLFITHDIREAIYLADRVLVMSGRPATISLELTVDLPRPHNRHDAKFQDYERQLEQAIGTVLA